MQPEKFKKTEEIQKSDETLNELELIEVGGGKQQDASENKNYVCPTNAYCPQEAEEEQQ